VQVIEFQIFTLSGNIHFYRYVYQAKADSTFPKSSQFACPLFFLLSFIFTNIFIPNYELNVGNSLCAVQFWSEIIERKS
jgi:hypothetical protein